MPKTYRLGVIGFAHMHVNELMRVFGASASAIRPTLGWEWLLDSWLSRWSERAAVRS